MPRRYPSLRVLAWSLTLFAVRSGVPRDPEPDEPAPKSPISDDLPLDEMLEETLEQALEPLERPSTPLPPAPWYVRAIRIGLVLLTLGAAGYVLFGGVLGDLSVDEVVSLVQGAGVLGIALYVLAFAALQPLGVSSHLFTASAGLIWAPWMAIPIALTGALASASVCFGFSRFVAYDWVQARLPEKLIKYEQWLVDNGLKGMILFRAITYTSQPAMFMMGTTRVSFLTMLLGSAVGFIPMVCLGVFFGDSLLRTVLGWFGM